ncbi:MAG: hypothetical protein HYZ50_20305 [Deltaproteobacteria bacterium]|nr:hypothetical protein [Deltaproteobacteria bacterium]
MSEGQLVATRLDQFLVVELPELHLPRPVCAPLRMLKELSAQLSSPPTMTLDGDTLVINDRWRLPTFDAAEFPINRALRREIQRVGEFFPIPKDLAALFPAISTDESRLQLCGVCFDQPNGKLVSSNGHVLYVLEGLPKGERRFTVPTDALRVVELLQRRATVYAGYYASTGKDTPDTGSHDFVRFHAPGLQLWTRLVEIDFPDYPNVFPHEQSIIARLTLPRAPLIEALTGALPFLPKKDRPESAKNGVLLYSVRLGEGVLHYESTETGTYTMIFPAPEWPIGFHAGLNVKYLLNVLKAVPGNPETVEVALASDIAPTRWAHGEFTAIIMPMRVFDHFPAELQAVIHAHKAQQEIATIEADERSLS